MSEQWFYTSSGRRLGPVSSEELWHQAEVGQLQPTDLVWCERLPQWVPARSVDGLLPESRGNVATLPAPVPLSRTPWDEPPRRDEPARQPAAFLDPPVQDVRLPEEDYRAAYEPRPSRQRTEHGFKEIKWVMGVSLAALAAVAIGVAVVVFATAAKDPGNIRSFPIRAGASVFYQVELKAGVKTQIWVTSERNTDIDLIVWDPNHQPIHKDERDHKDCYLEIIPATSGTHRLEVRNINLFSKLPVGRYQCTLRVEPPAKLMQQR